MGTMAKQGVPAVSVLLPVYNAEPFLPMALQSILDQTFADFECLVLDDGSTDASRAIAEAAAARDPRVRVTSRENRGLIATLNELIACARGRYLARMDADDIADPLRLERQVAYLDSHAGVVCLGGAQALIDDRGSYLKDIFPATDDAAIQASILVGHGAICHPTAMIRTEAMATVGGYDPAMRHCEDLDLWLRLGEIGDLANLSDVVLKYRLSTSSVSALNGKEQRDNGRLACEAAWARRGLSGMTYEAGDPWRPDGTPDGNCRFFLKYGWWAFGSGERRTAIRYALRALWERPQYIEPYKLAACAILKSPPARSV